MVETEDGTPNGYSAPGMIFLSPKGIGDQVGARLLANQISRQWWGTLVSPTSRNHMWLENGNARYAEMLYAGARQRAGGVRAGQVHDTYVEALTVDNPPVIQAGAAGRLFARVLGRHGEQGRGDSEHAALRDGRRELLQAAEGLPGSV